MFSSVYSLSHMYMYIHGKFTLHFLFDCSDVVGVAELCNKVGGKCKCLLSYKQTYLESEKYVYVCIYVYIYM